MVKVNIKNPARVKSNDAEWNAERKAVRALSSSKQCVAFRETKAANMPVTYVSCNVIYQEHNGVRKRIGTTDPRVTVVTHK